MILRPFFSFYGAKWRTARHYPTPEHETLVEPFAGSAGYAVRYADRKVVLVEDDPHVAGVWRFLLAARPAEILDLPDLEAGQTCSDLVHLPQEARWLIGFWLNRGSQVPVQRPGKWMREGHWPTSFWGPSIRKRIAAQLELVRHWRLIEGDYSLAPDIRATWYVDPPYTDAGRHYKNGAQRLDFQELARWCRARRGQTIVCEAEGATWLPFRPFIHAKANRNYRHRAVERAISKEAIWVSPRCATLRLKGRRAG